MSYVSKYKKGDILIESPLYGGREEREKRDFCVVNGHSTEDCFDINTDFVSYYGKSVSRNHNTYDHFWIPANEDDIKRFNTLLKERGYYFSTKEKRIILRDIETTKELKERLLKYFENPFNGTYEEEDCLETAIKKLL
jgi:hypothetical protein